MKELLMKYFYWYDQCLCGLTKRFKKFCLCQGWLKHQPVKTKANCLGKHWK